MNKILFFSHNLNLEGAPIFILNLVKGLKKFNYEIYIAALQDGPLKEKFLAQGVKVKIIDSDLPDKISTFIQTVNFDMIVFNTIILHDLISSLPQQKQPLIWILHESEIDHYKKVLKIKKQTFLRCKKVVFVSQETMKLYGDLQRDQDHFTFIHNGIDITEIEKFQSKNSQKVLRRQYGHQPDDLIISNIGTICQRKGQKDLVEAAIYLFKSKLVNSHKVYFYLVGFNPQYEYGNEIKRLISMNNLENNIRVVDLTKKVYDYFQMADIFCCTSYIESFPLVTLEAMAFGKAIISTDCYGIKEQIIHQKQGLLYLPGLKTALQKHLLDLMPDIKKQEALAVQARQKVLSEFTLEKMVEKFNQLFMQI